MMPSSGSHLEPISEAENSSRDLVQHPEDCEQFERFMKLIEVDEIPEADEQFYWTETKP